MLSLGLDLSEGTTYAVVTDHRGKVLAEGTGGDAAKAILKGRPVKIGGIASPGEADLPISGIRIVSRCTLAAAAVAAEAWIGAAQGVRNAVCLHVGEDVFAGLILDGKPWDGSHHRAGAAAWIAINPVERQDYRRLGSLAAEVSAKGVARRLSWRIQAGDRSRVLDAAGGSLDAITRQHVFEGARGGDGVAISVVRDTARYIGMAVATLAAAIDPDIVVVSGSVAAADLMLDHVRRECARRLPPDAMTDVRIEFSQLGANALAIGAARLAQLASA